MYNEDVPDFTNGQYNEDLPYTTIPSIYTHQAGYSILRAALLEAPVDIKHYAGTLSWSPQRVLYALRSISHKLNMGTLVRYRPGIYTTSNYSQSQGLPTASFEN